MRFRRLGSELAHPLPIVAVGLLALNDHVLKGSGLVAGWLTGKLSDFAGLFVFPVLLFVVADALTLRRVSRPAMRSACALLAGLLTIAGFCAIKLWPAANGFASAWLGEIRLDPGDLIALPAAACASLWLRRPRRPPSPPGRVLRFATFVAAAVACLATARPRLVRDYPVWQIESLGARRIGCAVAELWVSKSGKEGLGVTLELTPTASSCRVTLASARFSAGPTSVSAASLPPPLELHARTHLYVPFAFDNQALWNDGVRAGRIELAIQSGSERAELAFNLRQIWHGPHRVEESGHRPFSADASAPPPYRFAEPPP